MKKIHDKSSNVIEEVLDLERIPKRRWWIDLITQRHKRRKVIERKKVLDTRLGVGRKLDVQRGPEGFESPNVISSDTNSCRSREKMLRGKVFIIN